MADTYPYLTYIFAVTISTVIMMVFGGWVTERLHKGGLRFAFANKSRMHRKLAGFVLFITSIFILGYLSSQLQTALNSYFNRHFANSVLGIAVIFLIAWFMYDWVIWKKHNN